MYNVLKYRKTCWNNNKFNKQELKRNCNGTAFFVNLIKTSTVLLNFVCCRTSFPKVQCFVFFLFRLFTFCKGLSFTWDISIFDSKKFKAYFLYKKFTFQTICQVSYYCICSVSKTLHLGYWSDSTFVKLQTDWSQYPVPHMWDWILAPACLPLALHFFLKSNLLKILAFFKMMQIFFSKTP